MAEESGKSTGLAEVAISSGTMTRWAKARPYFMNQSSK